MCNFEIIFNKIKTRNPLMRESGFLKTIFCVLNQSLYSALKLSVKTLSP